MVPPNSVLFISDLHLNPHDTAGLELFYQFVQGPAKQATALYVLGDLFDVWVGYDINPDFHQAIQRAFLALDAQGVSLYFMSGNRDFLISRAFLRKCHVKKLPDPCLISLQGQPVLLTHGDRLCTQDIVYQRYRKVVQHPLTRILFRSLPKSLRQKIAIKLRSKSQKYQKTKEITILDVTSDAVLQLMSQQKVRQLIHGHVHRPNIHDLTIGSYPAKRLVLGDWHQKGSVIISTPSAMQLASFTAEKGLKIEQQYELDALQT